MVKLAEMRREHKKLFSIGPPGVVPRLFRVEKRPKIRGLTFFTMANKGSIIEPCTNEVIEIVLHIVERNRFQGNFKSSGCPCEI